MMEVNENNVQTPFFHHRTLYTTPYRTDDISHHRGRNRVGSANNRSSLVAGIKLRHKHPQSLSSNNFVTSHMKKISTPSLSQKSLLRSHRHLSLGKMGQLSLKRVHDDWQSLNKHVEIGTHTLHITYLALESVIIGDSPWNWLLTVIPQLINLCHLSLKETELTDLRLQGFLGTVCYTVSRGSPTPENIMVAHANGSEILPEVTSHSISMTSLTQLESLDLSFNKLTSKGVLYISKFLMWNLLNLKGLSLASNNIGDHGAQILAVYLSKMAPLVVSAPHQHKSNSLRRQDINTVSRGNDSGSHTTLIRTGNTELLKGSSRLNYRGPRLNKEERHEIETKLNKIIKMVRPSMTLSQGYSPSTEVTRVLLSNYPFLSTNIVNALSSEGEGVEQAKHTNKGTIGLTTLDMSNNMISSKGVAEILLAASKAMDLRVLLINSNLSNNFIDTGNEIPSRTPYQGHKQQQQIRLRNIFHELHRPNQLRCISLRNHIGLNGTSPADMRQLLLSIFFACDNLKVLDISGNGGIGDVFCRLLYDIGWQSIDSGKPAPRSLASLVAVDISDTGMSDAGAETLMHALVDFDDIISDNFVREENEQFGTSGSGILCNLQALNFDQDGEKEGFEGFSVETYRNLCSFFTEQDEAVMIGPLKDPFLPFSANQFESNGGCNYFAQTPLVSLLNYATTLKEGREPEAASSKVSDQKHHTSAPDTVTGQYCVSHPSERKKLYSPSFDASTQPSVVVPPNANDFHCKEFDSQPSQPKMYPSSMHVEHHQLNSQKVAEQGDAFSVIPNTCQIRSRSHNRILISPEKLNEDSGNFLVKDDDFVTDKNNYCSDFSFITPIPRGPHETPTPFIINNELHSYIHRETDARVQPILNINPSESNNKVQCGSQTDVTEIDRCAGKSPKPVWRYESNLRSESTNTQIDYQRSNESTLTDSPSLERCQIDTQQQNNLILIGTGKEITKCPIGLANSEINEFQNKTPFNDTTDVPHVNESIPVEDESSKKGMLDSTKSTNDICNGLTTNGISSVKVKGRISRSSSVVSNEEKYSVSPNPYTQWPPSTSSNARDRKGRVSQGRSHESSITPSRECSFRFDNDKDKEEVTEDNIVSSTEMKSVERNQSDGGASPSGDVYEKEVDQLMDENSSLKSHHSSCSDPDVKEREMELSPNSVNTDDNANLSLTKTPNNINASPEIQPIDDLMEKQMDDDEQEIEYDQLSECTSSVITDTSSVMDTDKSVKSAEESGLPFYLSTLAPYPLYVPPTKDPNDLQGRVKNFKLTYIHPPGHLLCIAWHALHAPQHSIEIWKQRVEEEVNESSKSRFLSLVTKSYLVAQKEYESKGELSLKELLLSPPAVAESTLKQFFVDSVQKRADSIHAAIVSDVSRFLQPIEGSDGDEDTISLSDQKRLALSTSKVVEDISMETDELMGTCTFSISTNERRNVVSSRLQRWANVGYDSLNNTSSFDFDANEIIREIRESTDESGEIDEDGWPALQHYLKRCMYYSTNGDDQTNTDMTSMCPAPPFTQSEVQWTYFLEKAIRHNSQTQKQEIGSHYPSIQHLLHEYHGRRGELTRELPEEIISDVTIAMDTLCGDMLSTTKGNNTSELTPMNNALVDTFEDSSQKNLTDNRLSPISHESRSSGDTSVDLQLNGDEENNGELHHNHDDTLLDSSDEDINDDHIDGNKEKHIEKKDKCPVKVVHFESDSAERIANSSDVKATSSDNSIQYEMNRNVEENTSGELASLYHDEEEIYANTKDEDLVPFQDLIRRRHQQQLLSFDSGQTSLVLSNDIRSPFAKSPVSPTTGSIQSRSRSLLNDQNWCGTARNCVSEEHKIAERLNKIRQCRTKGIQKLCYEALNLGTIPLNEATRKKRRISRGVLLGTKDEGDSGKSMKEEVSISVEWEELLVIKQYHGLSSKSLRLVHPLSAEGLLVVHNSDGGIKGGNNNEIVITMKQHYSPEELNVKSFNTKETPSKMEARILTPRSHSLTSGNNPNNNTQTSIAEFGSSNSRTSPYRSEFANKRVVSITVVMKSPKVASDAVHALQSAIVKAKEHFEERIRDAFQNESRGGTADEGQGDPSQTHNKHHKVYHHPASSNLVKKELPTPPE